MLTKEERAAKVETAEAVMVVTQVAALVLSVQEAAAEAEAAAELPVEQFPLLLKN
jgi:hypothetical protein